MPRVAVLEIRKPGNYQFTSHQFDIGPDFSPGQTNGEITWGDAGVPKEGKTGVFPLQIRWKKVALLYPGMLSMSEQASQVLLEVRDPGEPGTVIYTVSAALPNEAK